MQGCHGALCGASGWRGGAAIVASADTVKVIESKKGTVLEKLDLEEVVMLNVFEEQRCLVFEGYDRYLCFCVNDAADVGTTVTTLTACRPQLRVGHDATITNHPIREDIGGYAYHAVHHTPHAAPPNPPPQHPTPPPGYCIIEGITHLTSIDETSKNDTIESRLVEAGLRLVRVTGRGRCLIADEFIPAGTVVWSEEPLVVWQAGSESDTGVDVFREPRIAETVNLLQSHGTPPVTVLNPPHPTAPPPQDWYKRWAEVLQVNAWGFSAFDEEHRALFLLGSFMNHSCDPNTRYDTKEGRQEAAFSSLCDIYPGEELTVSYSHQLCAHLRQEEMRYDRRFACKCERCVGVDNSRALRCKDCQGFAYPAGLDDIKWTCTSCGGCGVDGEKAEKEEKWLTMLTQTHIDLADTPESHLVADFLFAVQVLGSRHWIVMSLAEHIITVPEQGGISHAGYAYLARIVLNWALEVYPKLLLTRPLVVQALNNCIAKLQSSNKHTLTIIALAKHLYPILRTFRGATDPDTMGMQSIASMYPGASDPLLGFAWGSCSGDGDECFKTLAGSSEAFRDTVAARIAYLHAEMAQGSDPYQL